MFSQHFLALAHHDGSAKRGFQQIVKISEILPQNISIEHTPVNARAVDGRRGLF
jgi:hypothetical protein